MRDIVYFDLETRHSAAEVGGWHNTAEMRLSVGVTYSTASGKYTIYSEEMVDDLIRQLSQADLVVGYNHDTHCLKIKLIDSVQKLCCIDSNPHHNKPCKCECTCKEAF